MERWVRPIRLQRAAEWICGFECSCGQVWMGKEFLDVNRSTYRRPLGAYVEGKRRTLSPEERVMMMRDIVYGDMPNAEIARKYEVDPALVFRYRRKSTEWIKRYTYGQVQAVEEGEGESPHRRG
jgi:transposase-like protein